MSVLANTISDAANDDTDTQVWQFPCKQPIMRTEEKSMLPRCSSSAAGAGSHFLPVHEHKHSTDKAHKHTHINTHTDLKSTYVCTHTYITYRMNSNVIMTAHVGRHLIWSIQTPSFSGFISSSVN